MILINCVDTHFTGVLFAYLFHYSFLKGSFICQNLSIYLSIYRSIYKSRVSATMSENSEFESIPSCDIVVKLLA